MTGPWSASGGRGGFTLVEVMVAMVITAVLLGAVTSSIVVASRALESAESPSRRTRTGIDLVVALTAELRLTTAFVENTATTVEITVPDHRSTTRVRYEWAGPESGVLTRSANGGDPVVVADDVRHFQLSYHETAIAGTGGTGEGGGGGDLNVLMVAKKDTDLEDQEIVRKFLLEAWGWSVTVIDDEASQEDFDTAFATHDVVYVPDTVNDDKLEDELLEAPIGVIVEHRGMAEHLQVTEDQLDSRNGTSLIVDDNTHYVTRPFFPGLLPLMTQSEPLLSIDGNSHPIAAGAQVLGSEPDSPERQMLFVLEAGETLYEGDPAAGRRVVLPWGNDLQFERLTDQARTLLRRAFEWAANAEVESEAGAPLFAQFPDGAGDDEEHEVKHNDWAVASIMPVLPPGTTGWRVTRFRFLAAQKDDPDQTLVIQVRGRGAAGEPTSLVYAQTALPESALPVTMDWVEVEFTMSDAIPAGEGACFAVGANSGSRVAEVRYQKGIGEATPNNQFWWKKPGDWDTNDDRDMPCQVDGTTEGSS